MPHDLSIVALIKDEDPYLPEWMEYHRALGVGHFFIYDNAGKVPLAQTLACEIAAGQATVIPFPRPVGTVGQRTAFTDFLTRFKGRTKWAAFIDPDEFLVPKSWESLPQLLSEFEAFGGLVVNWALFGSSGHEVRPPGLQIENFLMRVPDAHDTSRIVKSIIQPDRALSCPEPHSFLYKDGFFAVNESGARVDGRYVDASYRKIQLNHYFLRSLAEYGEKLSRWAVESTYRIKMWHYETYNKASTVKDESILRFCPLVRGALGGKK